MRPNLTFKHLTDRGFRPYRHSTVIWAKRMAAAFEVHTAHGPQRGQPGDYWCVGLHNRQWVSRAVEFERTHTRSSAHVLGSPLARGDVRV